MNNYQHYNSTHSNQFSNKNVGEEQYEIDASRFEEQEIDTAFEEGLLSTSNVFNRIMAAIDLNIKAFSNDAWCSKNIVRKMLVDKANSDMCIFTIRVSNRKLFRRAVKAPTTEDKIAYLHLMKKRLQGGFLNDAIKEFCAQQVELKNASKERKRAKRREEHEALKEAQRNLRLQAVMREKYNAA